MQRTVARLLAAAALVALTVPVQACSDSGGGNVGREERSLSGLLQWFPADTTIYDLFLWADLDAIRGGTRSSSVDDDAAVLARNSASGRIAPLGGGSNLLDPEFAMYAGFDLRDIAAWAEVGAVPHRVAVLIGRFDTGAIEKGLRSSPGGDALIVERRDGATIFSLGVGGVSSILDRSPVRPLAEPLVMAVKGHALIWSRDPAAAAAALEASVGESLADDTLLAAVARRVDESGAFTGGFIAPEAENSWQALAYGERPEDSGVTSTVAIAYSSASEATAAVDGFRAHITDGASANTLQPWADQVTLGDLVADGSVFTARFTTEKAGFVLYTMMTVAGLFTF